MEKKNRPADRPANEVYVTGTFDDWSKSAPLVKNVDGSWSVSIPLPSEKILYKFVVDDKWIIDDDGNKETDESGNTNNVLTLEDAAAATTPSKLPGAFIPESGGIPITKPAESSLPASGAKDLTGSNSSAESSSDAPAPAVIRQAKTIHEPFLGTPGIVIPQNAREIKELNINSTDVKPSSSIAPAATSSPEGLNKSATENQPPVHTKPAAAATTTTTTTTTTVTGDGSDSLKKKLTQEEALGAFLAPPGIVIPKNVAEVAELQQPRSLAQNTTTKSENTGFQAASETIATEIATEEIEVKPIVAKDFAPEPENSVSVISSEPSDVPASSAQALDVPNESTTADRSVESINAEPVVVGQPSENSVISHIDDTTSSAPEILNKDDVPTDLNPDTTTTSTTTAAQETEETKKLSSPPTSPKKSKKGFFERVRKIFK
ncbi:hypothetical protein V1514DRAFT_322493 [Lipomyces japonicus]|uniref:uncharacterized protein n=1 Tax=Lipomyces japonicus TaxID=56871 RepID=UPI0034CF051F